MDIRKFVSLLEEVRSEADKTVSPLPDEIAIICACAGRGQLDHRIGGLAANEIKARDGLILSREMFDLKSVEHFRVTAHAPGRACGLAERTMMKSLAFRSAVLRRFLSPTQKCDREREKNRNPS